MTENYNKPADLVTDIRLQNLFLHWASLDQGGFISTLLALKYGVRFLVVDQPYQQGQLQTHHGCDVWVLLAGSPKAGKTSFFLAAEHEKLVEFVNPDPNHLKRLELWKKGGPETDNESVEYSTSDNQTIVQTKQWKYFRVKLFDPRGEDINAFQNPSLDHDFYHRVFKTRSPSALILILNIDNPDERGAEIKDEIEKLLSIVRGAKQHLCPERDRRSPLPVYVLFNKCDQVGPDHETALTLEPARDKQLFPGNLPFFSSRSLGQDQSNTVKQFKNALRFCDAAQKYPYFRSRTEHFIDLCCELFEEVLRSFSNVNVVFCSSRHTKQHQQFPAVEALWSDICNLLKSGTRVARMDYFRGCQSNLETVINKLNVEDNKINWGKELSFNPLLTARSLRETTAWKDDNFKVYNNGIIKLEETISDSMDQLFTFLGIPYESTYGVLEKYPASLGSDNAVQQARSTILTRLRQERGIDAVNAEQVTSMLKKTAEELAQPNPDSWSIMKNLSERLRQAMVANDSELELHVDRFQGVFTTRCIIRDRPLNNAEENLFASADNKALKELFLGLQGEEKRRLFCRTLRNYGMHGKNAVRDLPFDGWTVAELWDGDAYKDKTFSANNGDCQSSVLRQEESATEILLQCADLHDRCLWVKGQIDLWQLRYQTLAWLNTPELTQILKRQFSDNEIVSAVMVQFSSLANQLINASVKYKNLRNNRGKMLGLFRGVTPDQCQEITEEFLKAGQGDIRISPENFDSVSDRISEICSQVQELKDRLTHLEKQDNFYGSIWEKKVKDLWITDEEIHKLPKVGSVPTCLESISNHAEEQKRVLVRLVATYMHESQWFSDAKHKQLCGIVVNLRNFGNGSHGASVANPLPENMESLFSLLKSAADDVEHEQ